MQNEKALIRVEKNDEGNFVPVIEDVRKFYAQYTPEQVNSLVQHIDGLDVIVAIKIGENKMGLPIPN